MQISRVHSLAHAISRMQSRTCNLAHHLRPPLAPAISQVHPEAGTTRDSVSKELVWKGDRMIVADTAGIRKAAAGGKAREELDRMAVRGAQVTDSRPL